MKEKIKTIAVVSFVLVVIGGLLCFSSNQEVRIVGLAIMAVGIGYSVFEAFFLTRVFLPS